MSKYTPESEAVNLLKEQSTIVNQGLVPSGNIPPPAQPGEDKRNDITSSSISKEDDPKVQSELANDKEEAEIPKQQKVADHPKASYPSNVKGV